jgi:ABC-2 type transport system permease protein
VSVHASAATILAYAYRARIKLLTAAAYRFDLFTRLITNGLLMVATVFLWRTAYQGIGQVAGVDRGQMLTYAVVSILMSSIFQRGVQDAIPSRVREGDIAVDLLRPMSPLGGWLADDIGGAAAALATQLPPLLLLGILIAHIPLPHSPQALLLFVPMVLLGFLINWLLAALVGLIAFWTIQLGHLGYVKDAIVRILSGSLAPLWFFPVWFQQITVWTPFPYAFQAPLGVYIGRTGVPEALRAMAIQGAWVCLLFGALALVWRAARRRVLVQGG